MKYAIALQTQKYPVARWVQGVTLYDTKKAAMKSRYGLLVRRGDAIIVKVKA